MYCRKCGFQLDDDVKFCLKCGEKVIRFVEANENIIAEEKIDSDKQVNNQEEPTGQITEDSKQIHDSGEKIKSWKDYITIERIERFSPIAALLPVAMAVVLSVVFGLLFAILGNIPVVKVICRILFYLVKALFILATLAATCGLVYVVVTKKDKSKINSWVAPFVTFLAFISCVGIAFGWNIVAWIFGVISVILGLELFARIVISNMPMDSPINVGNAFNIYKSYYNNYKEKNKAAKDIEKKYLSSSDCSKFDGSGIELFGYILLSVIVCGITCGIAAPWMICKVYKWRISHTVINGKRLTFTGNGGSLLGHWILWEILTIITCGIYGFFVHVALRKWELARTYIEGEPVIANGNESCFDGGSFAYFGYGLLSGLLLLITCGIAYPWTMAMIQKWDTKHQVINSRRLEFNGTGLGFLGEYLIILILTLITFGIYSPWGIVRMNKYIIRHTNFIN